MGKVIKRATAQNQDLLIKAQELNILEEINIGDTKMRLCATISGKSTFIQLWSGLSKQWNATHRYNVETEWEKWKKYAALHSKKQSDRGNRKSDLSLRGVKAPIKRKPRSPAKPSSSSDSVGNKRRKSENP